ncbi:unnamed protein product, partial [Polarella glacialis]
VRSVQMQPSRMEIGSERVVGERHISREELFSSGNLVEAPATLAPGVVEPRFGRGARAQAEAASSVPGGVSPHHSGLALFGSRGGSLASSYSGGLV